MKVNWNYPTAVRAGEGRAGEIAEICKEWGIIAPLVVTDPGIAALPMTEGIMTTIRDAGLTAGLFSDIKPNPTGGNVDAGIGAYRDGGHDGIIALGGGSGLDAGKAVAVALNPVPVADVAALTDGSGVAALSAPVSGRYVVAARAEGYEAVTREVEVDPGRRSEVVVVELALRR